MTPEGKTKVYLFLNLLSVLISISVFLAVTIYIIQDLRKQKQWSSLPEYVEISAEEYHRIAGKEQGNSNLSRPGETKIQASSSNRKGSIFLENTSGLEAAARIVPEGTRAGGRVLHINPNQRLPVQGIPAGKYSVYYSTGRNWDEGKKKFISQAMYSKSSIAMPSGRKWDVPVYLYHPEDPERRSSSAEEFSE